MFPHCGKESLLIFQVECAQFPIFWVDFSSAYFLTLFNFQVIMMTPSKAQRPILHATDVKFDECEGKNVLCAEPFIDLRRNYDVTFSQSDNVSTFMSVSAFSFMFHFL